MTEAVLDSQLSDFADTIEAHKTRLDCLHLNVVQYARTLRKFYGTPLIVTRPDSKWFAVIDYSFTLRATIGFSLTGVITLKYRDPHGVKQRRDVISVLEIRDHLDHEWNRIQNKKQQKQDAPSDETS